MSSRFERGASVILMLCALTIAGSVAWREFGPRSGNVPTDSPRPRVEYLRGWEEALAVGISVGKKTAPAKIIEFTDLECPACRRFQGVIREVLQENPDDAVLFFVHFPLPGHRFAMQAARAAECADQVGRFFPMVEAVFQKQDSLGIRPWGSFALDAGISDSGSIAACAADPSPIRRISAGIALAEKLQLNSTPTVLVNGWYFWAPTKENLSQAIEAIRRGKAPNEFRAP